VLREMLERHADPEIAIELNVRDDDGYLVEALRAALGDGLRPPKS
jgi:hypothetical protein